jgi:hypothetical protein
MDQRPKCKGLSSEYYRKTGKTLEVIGIGNDFLKRNPVDLK